MDGNICRCGTYERIVKAIERAAKVGLTRNSLQTTRRGFLGAAGWPHLLGRPGRRLQRVRQARSAAGTSCSPTPSSPSTHDDTVNRSSPPWPKMGQGTMTALPLLVAEELGRRLVQGPDRVRAAEPEGLWQPPPAPQWRAGLAGEHRRSGLLHAAARGRRAGAPGRRCRPPPRNGACRWAGWHRTRQGGDARSGRRTSYGEIATFAKMPAELPKAILLSS